MSMRYGVKHFVRNIFRCYISVRTLHYKSSASLRQPFNYVAQSRQDYRSTQRTLKSSDQASCDSRKDEQFSQREPYMNLTANNPFQAFDLTDGVYIVTGGAGGIGLAMSESLAEAGGEVYCLDRNEFPSEEFHMAKEHLHSQYGAGSLHYQRVDITDTEGLEATVENIASKKERVDGLIAAAAVIQVTAAMNYDMEDAKKLMDVNLIGALATANACAKQMFKYKIRGSMCLIASMSGLIANKGLLSPVYNASKAAVIQLARNLSMEWSKVRVDGTGGLRVNALSPGHVVTPMVRQTFKDAPGVQERWEAENHMGRLGDPSEFKGAALFLLSNASSYMTGNNLVIDGGHTAW